MCQRNGFFQTYSYFFDLDKNLEAEGTDVKNDNRYNNNHIKPWR